MKIAETSLKEEKIQWEKEKLLITSNFSFSYSNSKRPLLQMHKTSACLGRDQITEKIPME